jgi:hypothetical protein
MKDTDIIIYDSKKYSKESFMNTFGYTEQNVDEIVDMLVNKRLITLQKSEEEAGREVFDAATDQYAEELHGDQIQREEELRHATNLSAKSDDVYKEVRIPYNTFFEAEQAEASIAKKYGLETSLERKGGENYVVLYNVPDATLTEISRIYRLDRVIQSGVTVIQDSLGAVSSAVDYTINSVAAPVVKVGMKVAGDTAKSVSTFAGKTLGSAVNITAQSARDTAEKLKTDPDVIMAKRELIRGKDAVLNFLGRNKHAGFQITR